MAYHWTDSSPWHAQQRRQRLEGQARRAANAANARLRNLKQAEARIAELETENAALRQAASGNDKRARYAATSGSEVHKNPADNLRRDE